MGSEIVWPLKILPFKAIINRTALVLNLPPNLIAATIMTETMGDPPALRYEPTWPYVYEAHTFAQMVGSSVETEEACQKMAWGIMQVQGTVLRELGFRGWCSEICDPEMGIKYGSQFLKKKFEKYGPDPATTYASYNGGSPRKTKGGLWINQRHVDRFMTNYRSLSDA